LPPGWNAIIVADDCSTDSSVEEVERIAEQHRVLITLPEDRGATREKARRLRRAIAEARGDSRSSRMPTWNTIRVISAHPGAALTAAPMWFTVALMVAGGGVSCISGTRWPTFFDRHV